MRRTVPAVVIAALALTGCDDARDDAAIAPSSPSTSAFTPPPPVTATPPDEQLPSDDQLPSDPTTGSGAPAPDQPGPGPVPTPSEQLDG